MNGSLSDGNDNIIDIFVLSTSTTGSPLQARDLENLGYRATFFSDAQQLFESLRSGKPNLLICDSVTLRQESYELCQTLKADYDLWVVPVLIVTTASNLSDLLHVLDCNADNFISSPFDPAYFASLVQGMLVTPVERPTPEQIKTQFKIQHDDQQFVVTADRRRLLEFLLSSFEIAVNRSGDIIRITGERENLSASIVELEERVRDQSRSIEALNATLRQKEQAIGALTTEGAEKDQRNQESLDEIRRLEAEISAGKSHIADAEGEINRLTSEAADLARRYTEETGDLGRQLATISEHLAATSADLKATEESLALETTKNTDAETLLSETTARKEQAEKMAHELALEGEQLQADLLSERERVQNLVTEIAALTDVSRKSSEELTAKIQEQEEAIRNLEENLSLTGKELEAEKVRTASLDQQVADLSTGKQGAEEELRVSREASKTEIGALKERLTRVSAVLEARELDIAGLKTELDAITGARDTAMSESSALRQELSALKETLSQAGEALRAAEDQVAEEARERDAAVKEAQDRYEAVRGERDELRKELDRVLADRDAALATRSVAENSLEKASLRIRDLEAELGQAGSLQAETSRQVESLRAALEQAEAGAKEMESGLATARADHAESKTEIASLMDELGRVRTELESSQRERDILEESQKGEREERERIAAGLETAAAEQKSLASALAKEEQDRRAAESERERLFRLLASAEATGKTREAELSDRIQHLDAELDLSQATVQELENRVETLSREKQAAEDKVVSLEEEIDHARVALADEWESHMDAQERLVASAAKSSSRSGSLQEEELESEKAKKRELVVKGPDLPVSIGKQPQSLSPVKMPGTATPPEPQIKNVEDLFEDEPEETREEEELPKVTIIQEVAAGEGDEDLCAEMPLSGDDEGETEEDDEIPEEETTGEDDLPDNDDAAPRVPDHSGSIPFPGIAFNRAQWLDVLKWAHHSGTLSQEQRMQIVKMGRLIQKGRKLTRKQEEQVHEMLSLVQAQGYRFS
ncbi:response regulator [Methanoregula sp.]|uniref:response regulator n=1 Tax=Methanoregula sp. TaxID=2052170 RepID=UPI00261E4162|nr:response regulator [Methanoregula sp.]MDD5143804.1 response regulator [Methanoregula sp.]